MYRTKDETRKKLRQIVDLASKASDLSLDFETTGLDRRLDTALGLALAVQEPEELAVFLPIHSRAWSAIHALPWEEIADLLRPVLDDPRKTAWAFNRPFDLQHLDRLGIKPRARVADVQILGWLYDEHPPHNLKDRVERHLGHKMVRFDAFMGGKGARGEQYGFHQSKLPGVGPDFDAYAEDDARQTLRLKSFYMEALKDDLKLLRDFWEIEVPCGAVVQSMQTRGYPMSVPRLQEMQHELRAKVAGHRQALDVLAAKDRDGSRGRTGLNWNAAADVGWFLFDHLGCPVIETTQGGERSTKEDVLEVLAEDGVEEVHELLRYRKCVKFQGTFIDGFLDLAVKDPEHRIYPNFKQFGTLTGRLSSSEPNFQNLPRGNTGDTFITKIKKMKIALGIPRIREAFAAPSGWKLVVADYSMLELRIMAHVSKCPVMTEILRMPLVKNGPGDIHYQTQLAINEERREPAKNANFGFIYSMSAERFSEEYGFPIEEARKFRRGFFNKYVGILPYHRAIERLVKKCGQVRTVCGRIRHLQTELAEDEFGAMRQAVNSVVQGSAGDICKLAMRDIHFRALPAAGAKNPRIRDAYLANQVHDELHVLCPEEVAEEVRALVQQTMEQVTTLSVPLVADVKIGRNWAECK